MANRLKSRKSQSPNPEKLNPEKEEQVRVKELLKDERTRKIAGSVSLLAGLLLFIAFTSYLFTWKEDQDKVFEGATILLPSEEVHTVNLLGNFGAYLSHSFLQWFWSCLFFILFLIFCNRYQCAAWEKGFFCMEKYPVRIGRYYFLFGIARFSYKG